MPEVSEEHIQYISVLVLSESANQLYYLRARLKVHWNEPCTFVLSVFAEDV